MPTINDDELEESILCDKVGGKVSCCGYCDDIQEENIIRKTYSNKKKLNKFERNVKYKNHLKKLYINVGECYPSPVVYEDKLLAGRYYIENPKPYYKRYYRDQRSKYLKRQSNKRVRRYKGELSNGNDYRRIYDFWWEYC